MAGATPSSLFFFSSRRRHTRFDCDWSSDVCSSDLVDVISTQEIADNGQTEVNQILATLAPSFNASHQTIADGSDHINPASLRGLGPDQVLVLVNGKRRHSSAPVHVNGAVGRGTVGGDVNATRTAALDRGEVL